MLVFHMGRANTRDEHLLPRLSALVSFLSHKKRILPMASQSKQVANSGERKIEFRFKEVARVLCQRREGLGGWLGLGSGRAKEMCSG